jgi:hypothetical protein
VPAGSDLMVNLLIQALDDQSLPPGLAVDSAPADPEPARWKSRLTAQSRSNRHPELGWT